MSKREQNELFEVLLWLLMNVFIIVVPPAVTVFIKFIIEEPIEIATIIADYSLISFSVAFNIGVFVLEQSQKVATAITRFKFYTVGTFLLGAICLLLYGTTVTAEISEFCRQVLLLLFITILLALCAWMGVITFQIVRSNHKGNNGAGSNPEDMSSADKVKETPEEVLAVSDPEQMSEGDL